MNNSFSSFLFIFLVLLNPKELFSQNEKIYGKWFECEFSISGSIPFDDCDMLDDDGFLVEENNLYHLKIISSNEINCRGNKKGNCFKFKTNEIKTKKSKLGKIESSTNNIKVKYMGCSQIYWIKQINNKFWKIFPDQNKCYWTREKNFYVRKWEGRLLLD